MFFCTLIPSCFAGNLKGFLALPMKESTPGCSSFCSSSETNTSPVQSTTFVASLCLPWISQLAFTAKGKKMEAMVSIIIIVQKMVLLTSVTTRDLH